jgi:hypothetical protein
MISKVSLRLFEKFEVFEKRPSVIAPHGLVKKTFVCLTVVRHCDLVPFPLPFSVMKGDSSLISTSVRMVHPQRTSDEKRPGRGHQRINPREFATTGPITPETAANYLLHRGLRQDGGGDQ